MTARQFVVSYCICEECGLDFPIPRGEDRLRAKGHIKTFYCYVCQRVTDHLEQRG